jgi:hypothetical protein
MKKYNNFAKTSFNKVNLSIMPMYKEGFFKGRNNKFVVRVRKGFNKTFSTLSLHDTEEGAKIAYENFKKEE